MVFYWIIVFTGLRAAVINYGMMELAKKGGIKIKRDQVRFAEQAWLFVYYLVFWSLGMVSENLEPLHDAQPCRHIHFSI